LLALGITLALVGTVIFLYQRLKAPNDASWRRKFTGLAPAVVLGLIGLTALSATARVDEHSHDDEAEVLGASSDPGHHESDVADQAVDEIVTDASGDHGDAEHDDASEPDAAAATEEHSDGHVVLEDEGRATEFDADHLLTETRAAATKYNDFAVAEAEGFVQSTPWALGDRGPAHFINATYYLDDDLLDPNRPESLVYFRFPDGGVLLIGVMYLAAPGEGLAVSGDAHWHTHADGCFGAGGLVLLDSPEDPCPPGTRRISEQSEMLHVWLFDGPSGPFGTGLTREDYLAAAEQLLPR
jgi:hypothetical protein